MVEKGMEVWFADLNDVIAGPARLKAVWVTQYNDDWDNVRVDINYRRGPAVLSYGIGTLGSTASNGGPNVSSQVAVIPNDANGQFEVILESSVDLVTWNVANPGTFGGDTPRRFFRTRIVRKN